MIIRNLQSSDFENGFIETLSNLSNLDGLTEDRAKEIFVNLDKKYIHIYVMQENEQIVGTVTLLLEQKFLHDGGLTGHIEDVSTRKGFEHKGIASALLKHTIAQAKALGCYKVILDCAQKNEGFYERLGFFKHETCMRLDIK